jgi:hypothetical protein
MPDMIMRADLEKELERLKAHLLLVIDTNDRRYEERAKSEKVALSAALAANDKRLDGMNEFRGVLSDQAARAVTRAEFEASRDASREDAELSKQHFDQQLRTELSPLRARIDEIGRPNWTLLISSMSALAVLVTGIWIVIGLRIDATVSPVGLAVAATEATVKYNTGVIHALEQTTTGLSASSSETRKDVENLKLVDNASAQQLGESRARGAEIKAKLIEIETQFCASDTVRNVNLAHEMRLLSLLWGKTFPGQHLPSDNAFYPKVCNRLEG